LDAEWSIIILSKARHLTQIKFSRLYHYLGVNLSADETLQFFSTVGNMT